MLYGLVVWAGGYIDTLRALRDGYEMILVLIKCMQTRCFGGGEGEGRLQGRPISCQDSSTPQSHILGTAAAAAATATGIATYPLSF